MADTVPSSKPIRLKSSTKTIITVDYSDLDDFVQLVTNQKDYQCVAEEEWGNDSDHEVDVKETPLDDYAAKDWAAFKDGKKSGSYMIYTIMNGLCVDGLIPPGNYLIKA